MQQDAPSEALAGGRLTIDLAALAGNWRTLAAMAPGAGTGAVVKGDGYGIGLEPAVRTLLAAGCRTFFVALADEGRRTRNVAPEATVYVLDGLLPGSAPALAAGGLRPILGSLPEIEEWAAWRRSGGRGTAAIHIDTGMNRLGLSPDEARAVAARPDLVAAIAPALVMSHLACADVPGAAMTARQQALFAELAALFPGVPASLANSAGVLRGPDYHFDLTRPGIALYGAVAASDFPPLRPVVTAEARILTVRDVPAGEAVGYGAAQRVGRRSRLAILGAGYADGYHRAAGAADSRPGAAVIVRGERAPLVGRVSMDLMAADVTDIPRAARGDYAELFGPTIAVDAVAAAAGTIGYELLTGLGRRYARRYVGG